MARVSSLSIMIILNGLAACACVLAASASDSLRQDPASGHFPGVPGETRFEVIPGPSGRSLNAPAETKTLSLSSAPALSAAVHRVSQIAGQNGDKIFLVVDKIHGKIVLFENGQAKFVAAALTGQNTADVMPPDAIGKTYAQQVGVKYKVTPAGRYTVSKGFDPQYGAVLDINEIQGPDWALAIHQVALWNKSQQRDARLRSASDEDKHITDGCIDVEPGTIRQLVQLLAHRGDVPIYILPMDETLTPGLFPVRAEPFAEHTGAGSL